jgi:hypothetical protein
MKFFDRLATLATVSAVCLWVAACGGSVSTTTGPAPSITSFTASPATITAGTSSSLTGIFSGGAGVITGGSSSISAASGTAVTVSPASTTTYTLTVTATNGTQVTATATVTVTPAAPTITSFTASPTTITAGGSSSLTAVFAGGTGVVTPGNITVTSGTAVSVSPTTTTTYTLTVTPGTGTAITQTAVVTVVAAPVITSFLAAPSSVESGTSSNLTAVFTGGTGMVTPGNLPITSGTPLQVTAAETTTYTLTVTNAAGTALTQMVTVTVVPAPAITSFTATPATITAGGSSSLDAVFTGGAGVVTPGNIKVTSGTAVNVSPATTATYTLTVTPSTGTAITQAVTVTVVPAPVISSFSANPTSITSGDSSDLTGVFTGGTGVVTPGNLSITSNTPLPVSPTSTTTYTLTVENAANTSVTQTASVTVTAAVPIITVTPSSAVIGTQQQFNATASNFGSKSTAVTWTVSAPGSSLSPGDISSTGLYNTPYPAPATVTVTATSVAMPTVSGSATVTLSAPATATGPALAVDVNTPNTPSENPHAINPYVYGMNAYVLDSASQTTANPSITRWGGDDTTRYNYKNTWSNSASDWYFENGQGSGGMPGGGAFNAYVSAVHSLGADALGSVPVNGWVSNGTNACGFPQSAFPNQIGQNGDSAFQSYYSEMCGYGVYPDGDGGCTSSGGCSIYVDNTNADPSAATTEAEVTSIAIDPPDITAASTPAPGSSQSTMTTWANGTWDGGWVNSLVSTTGIGPGSSSTGVQVWDLDNEPTWWSAVHRDVHPYPFTYDEVTNRGIGTALAVKTADPSAQVSGPVIDYWWGYFYSMQDIWNGWSTGPCYEPWSDPTDRAAHGGTPLIEYYLQQFNKYSQQYGIRLLDYVDIHGYFAPDYNGNSVAFTTAGDTQEQKVRLNSTRVFWDPTYTDPNYPQPDYSASPTTQSCTDPPQSPEVIPMLKTWVANDYPGTKTAIDEYNFGGLESINGAVVQADILGIFGREALDLGAFWPTTNYNQQTPGNFAFAIYRNYDGKDSTFGDIYLSATSTASGADAEGQLSVYGAQRSSDNSITVMVINKTYGSLTSTLSLENFTAGNSTTAQVFQYSNANLNAIAPQTAATVTPPAGSGTTSTVTYTFPAQSITLFVIPD